MSCVYFLVGGYEKVKKIMHKRSKFSDLNSYYHHQKKKGVSNQVLKICEIIINDLKINLKLDESNFVLADTMVTYYVENEVFGNIRFNKDSIRVEPLFAGSSELGYKIQNDGYVIHSIKIESSDDYNTQKKLIFRLLEKVYQKKKNKSYEDFINKFLVKLDNFISNAKK